MAFPWVFGNLAAGNQAASKFDDNFNAIGVSETARTTLATVAGTNTITGALTPVLAAYVSGQIFAFIPAGTNTGATTLNISGLGAQAVRFGNAALVGGEIRINVPCYVFYDGTNFQLLGPFVGGTVAGAVALTDATDATSTITGSLKTAGGLGVVKALWVGGLANIAGVTSLQAGTVGTPALQFGGDTTSGIYRPAANQIGVAASGAQVALFQAGSSTIKALTLTAGGIGITNNAWTGTSKSNGVALRAVSGTANADVSLNLSNNAGAGTDAFFGVYTNLAYAMCDTQGVKLASGGTAWAADSDERMKILIEPITDAASKLSKMRTMIGRYKDDKPEKRRPFFIAQDALKVLPEIVTEQEDDDHTLMMSYTEMTPLMAAATNEHTAQLAAIEARLVKAGL